MKVLLWKMLEKRWNWITGGWQSTLSGSATFRNFVPAAFTTATTTTTIHRALRKSIIELCGTIPMLSCESYRCPVMRFLWHYHRRTRLSREVNSMFLSSSSFTIHCFSCTIVNCSSPEIFDIWTLWNPKKYHPWKIVYRLLPYIWGSLSAAAISQYFTVRKIHSFTITITLSFIKLI